MPTNLRACRLELFLMKKRLRRESERLQRNAKLSLAIMQAARVYPDAVGAAFRTRSALRKRRNLLSATPTYKRCFYVDRETRIACANIPLPRSSTCADHVAYNVGQRAFAFCATPCCGKPVSKLNARLFDGMCHTHYHSSRAVRLIRVELTLILLLFWNIFRKQPDALNCKRAMRPTAPARTRRTLQSCLRTRSPKTATSSNTRKRNLCSAKTLTASILALVSVQTEIRNAQAKLRLLAVVEGDVSLASVADELYFENNINELLLPGEPYGEEPQTHVELDDAAELPDNYRSA